MVWCGVVWYDIFYAIYGTILQGTIYFAQDIRVGRTIRWWFLESMAFAKRHTWGRGGAGRGVMGAHGPYFIRPIDLVVLVRKERPTGVDNVLHMYTI